MDGGPIKNETIPIRFYLKPYELTPTMTNINNRFSVQYFINLVLSDVEDRKYFKQHEISLHRIEKKKKPFLLNYAEKILGQNQQPAGEQQQQQPQTESTESKLD